MSAFPLPEEEIREYCKQKPIKRLSLFGSILTDKFGPESDVDLLVEFVPNSHVDYFDMTGFEIDLTEMLGRKVDLRTPMELHPRFRQTVLDSARQIYVHR